jgi:hypothetical protein
VAEEDPEQSDVPPEDEYSYPPEESEIGVDLAVLGDETAGIVLDPANLPETEPQNTAPVADRKKAMAEKKKVKKAKELPAQSKLGIETTAIVKAESQAMVLGSGIDQLDRYVSEIKELDRKSGESAYVLAEKLVALDKSMLWKLRLAADAKVKYGTFEKFCFTELDMGREYVLNMKKCIVRYTREDFMRVGPSKLRFVMRAPEEQQQEVLDQVKAENTPKHVLEDDVAERRKKAGLKPSRPKSKREEKTAERKARGQEPGKITVAAILGKGTANLYKRPAKGEEMVRAKMADGGYAWIDMGNEVRCHLHVRKLVSGFVVQWEMKRIEE